MSSKVDCGGICEWWWTVAEMTQDYFEKKKGPLSIFMNNDKKNSYNAATTPAVTKTKRRYRNNTVHSV